MGRNDQHNQLVHDIADHLGRHLSDDPDNIERELHKVMDAAGLSFKLPEFASMSATG